MKSFWTREYQRHIGKMIGICYRYVPDRATAEDLAHSAFLQAIEKAGTFKGIGRFDKWLMRITVNTALTHLRKTSKGLYINENADMDNLVDPYSADDEMPAEEMMAAIRKADFTTEEILHAIAQLPDNHRIVLNLYVFEHYTHQQIAIARGISVNTSKSHLMRARKELQQILFQQSKHKKQPLMMFFPLFTAPEAAIDAYCRRKLDGFTMVPQNPLPESSFPPSNSIPSLRLRLRAYRAPIAAGITTAGVAGAIIFVNTAQPLKPISSEPKDNQNITINDSTLVNNEIGDSTVAVSATVAASSTPYRRSVATKHSAGTIKEDQGEENPTSKSDTLITPESGHPPVVVKKVRRTNRTIVIQDSLKR